MTYAMDETTVTTALVVGRVPVVDDSRMIVGFELASRPASSEDGAAEAGASEALVTMSSLLGSVDFDLHGVVGDRLLFCTVDRAVLVGDARLHLSPRMTVIEVPVLAGDTELVDSVRSYKRDGFAILVQHVEWADDTRDLLALADLVKVDLATRNPGEIMDIVGTYADLSVELLATGCDTAADLAWAQAVGFDLFLGQAVQAPEPSGGSAIAPSALSQVQLGMELLSRDLDLARIEEVLRGDPALVMQLLNMASMGAGGGLRREVRSLREALVVMGTIRLRQWAALVILSRHGRIQSDALVTALVRARMCELLAPDRAIDPPFAFTAGLLSALDLVLGVPLAEIERQVQLDHELKKAAFWRQGALGELIGAVENHERTIDTGRELSAQGRDITMIGAMAFRWATKYAGAMDSARA